MTRTAWRRFARLPLAVITAFVLMPSLAWAGPAVELLLTPQTTHQRIGTGIEYLGDLSGALGVADAASATGWQRNAEGPVSRGYSGAAWWLRWSVKNDSGMAQWLLVTSYSQLDHLDVYLLQGDKILSHTSMGDSRPFRERPVAHRYFVAPLNLASGVEVQVYVRVRTTGSAYVPLDLWTPQGFWAYDSNTSALHLMFIGAVVAMALYNLLLYLGLHDRVYFQYAVFVMLAGLFFVSMDGWTFQHLWPELPQLNGYANALFSFMACLCGLIFTRRFLDVRQLSWRLDWVTRVAMAGILVAAGLSVVLPYKFSVLMLAPVSMTTSVCAMACGLSARRFQPASARTYLAAWSGLLMGVLVFALADRGLLPANVFTRNAPQIGLVIGVLLLSFALAHTINAEKSLRLKAQQDLLDTHVQNTKELELRVQERTQQLQVANRKLEEASNTDQLTGVRNRRFLDHYLQQEFARACRSQHPLVVMLIDVDHFKKVNDTHGHLVGDECLREVATRAAAAARRAGDLVARYGGEEFCVVLPETDHAGAVAVAEQIRQAVSAQPVQTAAGPITITCSVGVCAATASHLGSPSEHLKIADTLLYEAKNSGRNRVCSTPAPAPASGAAEQE